MKVYHGSYTRIESVDLSQAEANKDFGKGFYVTGIRKHASDTFTQLSDANTGLYLKPWQEIYEMIKTELMMTQNN